MHQLVKFLKLCAIYWKSMVIVWTPILLCFIFTYDTGQAARCAYVMSMVAIYWVTEAIPLAITAFLPVFLLPIMGLSTSTEVSSAYMTRTVMLFIGGYVMAAAIEHCNLHRRIALFVILKIGQSIGKLMAGFMMTTMVLSMWISNGATVAMMLPIVTSILTELKKTRQIVSKSKGIDNAAYEIEFKEEKYSKNMSEYRESRAESNEKEIDRRLKDMFFLAIAYSANIGGTGSPTGSGPNMVTKALFDNTFREDTPLTYASWVIFNTPGMIICVSIGWFWLQLLFLGFGFWKSSKDKKESEERVKSAIVQEYEKLGKITFHEIVVSTLFTILVLLWLLRSPGFMPGWNVIFDKIFGKDVGISDATATWFIVILLFMIPSKPPNTKTKDLKKMKPSEGCLTWEVVHEKTPWDVIFLLGGGIALARASKSSGLSSALAEKLRALSIFPAPVVVFFISLLAGLMTEITSNTTTGSIIMPILKDMSMASCINPLYVIVPATTCCCYAFMLPVATPPNAYVHSRANMKTITMIKAGIGMNIICIFVINIMINTLGVPMYDVMNFPKWANSTTGDVRCINDTFTDM